MWILSFLKGEADPLKIKDGLLYTGFRVQTSREDRTVVRSARPKHPGARRVDGLQRQSAAGYDC